MDVFVAAENGIDPDKERAHCPTKGGPHVRGQCLLVSGVSLRCFINTSDVTPT